MDSEIAVGAVILVFIAGAPDTGSGVSDEPSPSREDYQALQQDLDYRKAMLGDYEDGELIITRGEIAQVFRETNILLDTEFDEMWGYLGEKVWLKLEEKPRVLEGDVIEVFARYGGTQKYESTFGAEQEVPMLKVDYIDVVE